MNAITRRSFMAFAAGSTVALAAGPVRLPNVSWACPKLLLA